MIYVFDSNSLRVLSNYYPANFPTFWERFERAVDTGEVVSVREVYKELEHQVVKEWFLDWIKKRRSMFLIPGAQETEFVGEIFRVLHFQTLVGETQRLKGQPVADPFVVAAAKVCNGTVVTEEADRPNAAKIPNVCAHFQVPFTNVEGFLSRNGWKF